MYIPDIYINENQEEIMHFLQKNSFGILINQNGGNILATHIPLEIEVKENILFSKTGRLMKFFI